MDSQSLIKCVHLFKEDSKQYVLVKSLATGTQSSAQLVLDLHTGEYLVRKVSLRRSKSTDTPDPEWKILKDIETKARKLNRSSNVIEMRFASFVATHRRLPSDPAKWCQVSYFPFYNAGSLDTYMRICVESGLVFPRRLILPFIKDVARGLTFIYSCQIVHADLHAGNIFLHVSDKKTLMPTFFLADFGCAISGEPTERFVPDVYNFYAIVMGLLRRSEAILGDEDDLLAETVSQLQRLSDAAGLPGTSTWPDLSTLLDLISQAPGPKPTLEELGPLFGNVPAQARPTPAYYERRQDCLEACNVRGPWHLARVRVDASGAVQEVLQIFERAHHHPNENDADSDTDGGQEGVMVTSVDDEDLGVEVWD